MRDLHDVIVAGAGPVGLFLACELALAGAEVLILERDLEPESPLKGPALGRRGLNTVSVEAIYRRGLLPKFFDGTEQPLTSAANPEGKFAGHFAGIMLHSSKIELDRWKYHLPGPAMRLRSTSIAQVEKILTERAEDLGVTIIRGEGFASITAHDNDSVTVQTAKNRLFRGRWLVGCDGGRSAVRKAAGIELVGTEAKSTGYAVKCELSCAQKLRPGFQPTETGLYFATPESLHLMDFDGGAFAGAQVSREHVQEVLRRVSGVSDVGIAKMVVASTFSDRCKQAEAYRRGRILLAGDAAHIHAPLGAQGLNLGLGDAMNLGWKLAAAVLREVDGDTVDLALLDTYESERRAVGAWVLQWARAQVVTLLPDPFSAALRNLFRDLIDTTDGTNLFVDRVWGLSQRYQLGDGAAHAHPLVGASAPDLELLDGSKLGSKLEGGRGLLLDVEDSPALRELVGGQHEAKVDYVAVGARDSLGLRAFLVRPDGVVAWVAEGNAQPDVDAAKAALQRWFGY
ncbi:FAD binding domain-containing protein [Thozetella sp. PMI_491]|nr:FAD binding domain-containing protein [Thozetella sp. PMI_491]